MWPFTFLIAFCLLGLSDAWIKNDKAESKTCRVLSFSGGGVFGAYESGVVKGLVEKCGAKSWDVYSGISVGSINSAWMATIKPGTELDEIVKEFTELWEVTLGKSSALYNLNIFQIFNFFFASSMLDNTPMIKNLHKYLKPRGMPICPLIIGTTSLINGKQVIFTQPNINQTYDRLFDIVRASCSIPGVFPPVNLDGNHFVDGGTSHNEILDKAVSACPEGSKIEMDVILTSPNFKKELKTHYNYIEVLLRSNDVKNFANQEFFLKESALDPRITQIKFYRPDQELPGNMLDFSHMTELVDIGFNSSYCGSYNNN